MITVKDIIAFLGDAVLAVDGEVGDAAIDNLADVAHVRITTLDWVKPSPTSQLLAEESKAKTLLVGPEVFYSCLMADQGKILVHVKSPKMALALVGNEFFVKKLVPGIHPAAIVDPEAVIGDNVYIGPYAVIGKAKIGDSCIIESGVRIYDNVTIGSSCHIKPGAVIGGEGFGFERDENGNKFRFPQIGRVIIGDDVEIGSNSCIDRGALSDTMIGNHTKINNLCHIAHNNTIGINVTIAGCVNVSGSCVVEDNVWISPNVSLRGFNHLGEGCIVGTGAVVTKNIPAGETWVGNPAKKMEK